MIVFTSYKEDNTRYLLACTPERPSHLLSCACVCVCVCMGQCYMHLWSRTRGLVLLIHHSHIYIYIYSCNRQTHHASKQARFIHSFMDLCSFISPTWIKVYLSFVGFVVAISNITQHTHSHTNIHTLVHIYIPTHRAYTQSYSSRDHCAFSWMSEYSECFVWGDDGFARCLVCRVVVVGFFSSYNIQNRWSTSRFAMPGRRNKTRRYILPILDSIQHNFSSNFYMADFQTVFVLYLRKSTTLIVETKLICSEPIWLALH